MALYTVSGSFAGPSRHRGQAHRSHDEDAIAVW